MRTTVTLEPDVEALLRARMRDRGQTFKVALNEALRAALAPTPRENFRTPTFAMGEHLVPLDKALRLAGELEDEELIRRLAVRK